MATYLSATYKRAILGSKPKNLSPNVISRLKSEWYDQYLLWQRRDLSKKKYVYFWARMESEKNCILVIIGVDEYGKKELVAIDDGLEKARKAGKDYYST
jgi:transposase-like protein